jgi:hypothetical protein
MSNELPPLPLSEAKEQSQAKALRLAGSFAEVVGQPRGRTDAQKRFLEHLESFAGEECNNFVFTRDNGDGIKIALAAAQRDGAKSVLREIEKQLAIAARGQNPGPRKTRVIKN